MVADTLKIREQLRIKDTRLLGAFDVAVITEYIQFFYKKTVAQDSLELLFLVWQLPEHSLEYGQPIHF